MFRGAGIHISKKIENMFQAVPHRRLNTQPPFETLF
jgi:hypothetical protein